MIRICGHTHPVSSLMTSNWGARFVIAALWSIYQEDLHFILWLDTPLIILDLASFLLYLVLR